MNASFNHLIVLLCAGSIFAGCSKSPGNAEADRHAGHDHKLDAARGDAVGSQAGERRGETIASAAKCAAHGAPKSQCFICDPALREKGRLWCGEHARYEDRCWECHPELQDKSRLYCGEHGLYEDECFICHPEVTPPAASAAAPQSQTVLICAEHQLPETECGICHPEMAAQLKPGQSIKVRLPTTNSAALAGIVTGTAERGGLGEGIECLGEITFDQNKLAQIAAPVGGIIQSVEADLGARVRSDQAVAKIWSATIAEAVAKAVLTHQTLERERKLRAERVTSERDLQQAEAEHRAACQQARTLGFSEEQIDTFGANPDEPVMLEVRAPFAGEIVERSAVRGALIESGKPLFTIADRSTMWAMLSVPETALVLLREGQTVQLQVDSLPGRTFAGKLTWVGAKVDERTRMASARVELVNPDGLLRANMFARARIVTRNPGDALVVPAAAVHTVEGKPLVFVKLSEDLFAARAVRLGGRLNGKVEVLEGLESPDAIVVEQGFPLKSQLLISRLGAGCVHE